MVKCKAMKMNKLWVPVMVVVTLASSLLASNPLTNYKSGISVGFSGQDEKDYVFERWYHDPLIDDHGTVYLKDTTKLSFSHNERNTMYVLDGSARLKVVEPSKGIIRYRLDRDLNYRWVWAVIPTVGEKEAFPAYTAPFSLGEITYAPEDPAVKVVGTTGPKPGVALNDSAESRRDYYHRGMLDEFGDEWHVLTVGDDDVGIDPELSSQPIEGRAACSDGKIHYLVVNPKTPAIFFNAVKEGAQFYTTPIKNYFVPVLHKQTSYVTDGVEISLANIMSEAPVYYRFDQDSFRKYEGPISIAALKDGEHMLEYYYQEKHHRIRKIVKHPEFPSDKDVLADGRKHGYLLWKDDAEFQQIKERLTGPATTPTIALQKKWYEIFLTAGHEDGNGQDGFNAAKRKGLKVAMPVSGAGALINAFIVQMEGLDKAPKYALAAKQMMMESEISWDQVGYERSSWWGATPGDDFTCGYYKVMAHLSTAFAYDLLITRYRQPQYPDGFTAIEDLKVRDSMCNLVWIYWLHRGQYHLAYEWMKFWASARGFGVTAVGLAMPSYDTEYYGTTGFNGSKTARPGSLPFPDQTATWYQLVVEDSVPKKNFPNQALDFGLLQSFITNPYFAHGGEKVEKFDDGCIALNGDSLVGTYTTYSCMGKPMGIYANLMKINLNKSWDWLDKFFEKSNTGAQVQKTERGILPGYYPNFPVLNKRFHAEGVEESFKYIQAHGGIDYCDIWNLLWCRIPEELEKKYPKSVQ